MSTQLHGAGTITSTGGGKLVSVDVGLVVYEAYSAALKGSTGINIQNWETMGEVSRSWWESAATALLKAVNEL